MLNELNVRDNTDMYSGHTHTHVSKIDGGSATKKETLKVVALGNVTAHLQ
jgi:hypothetical protein